VIPVVNANLFLKKLRDSQLVPAAQLERVESRLHAAAGVADVAADFIEQGLLTPYQVERLESGSDAELVVGPYRILQELGRGGFGCVYKAVHVLMDRVVALKVIDTDRVEDDRARDMFLREVRAATRLHHPNIALAYDAGESHGRLFMALEYIEGPTLDQYVRTQGPLPLNLAWLMLQQTALALRCAHAQGMVHRDIKPANLLIPQAVLEGRSNSDNQALVKVVDFGLARLQVQGASKTLFADKGKVFAGTPDFVSPEQARCLHDVDIRSDLYSLGCTFYFALAARKPFQGNSVLEIVLQHLEKEAEPLEYHRPDTPANLVAIIRRLMEKHPEKRFQSASELLGEMGYLSVGGSQPIIVLPSWPNINLPPTSTPNLALPPVLSAPSSPRKHGLSWPELAREDNLSATVQLPAADSSPLERHPARASTTPEVGQATVVTMETSEAAPSLPPAPVREPAAELPGKCLDQAWRQWHPIVASLAAGDDPRISPADYKSIHRLLLRELRAHALAQESRRDVCCRLESLVEPWVTVQTLHSTDIATLREITGRAGTLARELGLGTPAVRVPWSVIILLIVLLVLPVSAISSLQLSAGHVSWHLPSAPSAWHFLQANPILSLTLLLPGTVLGGLYGLARLLRG
jgi:serine/threonine-protein kinase